LEFLTLIIPEGN
ncbi:hypothetical protein CP8484711_1458, partial [Chlamydia psittaci 84-8471/1]